MNNAIFIGIAAAAVAFLFFASRDEMKGAKPEELEFINFEDLPSKIGPVMKLGLQGPGE